jgi:hypothetical protein
MIYEIIEPNLQSRRPSDRKWKALEGGTEFSRDSEFQLLSEISARLEAEIIRIKELIERCHALDEAADKMAEEINSGNPDIAKCFAIGLKAMKKTGKIC